MKHAVIPIFIPHKGCPFDCTFCNQKSISGQMEQMTEEKIITTIEQHLSTISQDVFVEIGFYGGSFTGIEKEEQKKYLEIAKRYIDKGFIKEVRISTRPDYIDEATLCLLKDYHVKTIELGVQSLDEEVLRLSMRGHSAIDVIKSAALIKAYGFRLGIQTMVGLLGDTEEKSIQTAKGVIDIHPEVVRIYPALVIKNTMLQKLYASRQYEPFSLEQAVELCAVLLDMYHKKDISVIRLGLQPTENINSKMDVVAGPFHPAFRQLVVSRLLRKEMEDQIEAKQLEHKEGITICTDKKNISNIIGQKRSNVIFLKTKYGFRSILIKEIADKGSKINIY